MMPLKNSASQPTGEKMAPERETKTLGRVRRHSRAQAQPGELDRGHQPMSERRLGKRGWDRVIHFEDLLAEPYGDPQTVRMKNVSRTFPGKPSRDQAGENRFHIETLRSR